MYHVIEKTVIPETVSVRLLYGNQSSWQQSSIEVACTDTSAACKLAVECRRTNSCYPIVADKRNSGDPESSNENIYMLF